MGPFDGHKVPEKTGFDASANKTDNTTPGQQTVPKMPEPKAEQIAQIEYSKEELALADTKVSFVVELMDLVMKRDYTELKELIMKRNTIPVENMNNYVPRAHDAKKARIEELMKDPAFKLKDLVSSFDSHWHLTKPREVHMEEEAHESSLLITKWEITKNSLSNAISTLLKECIDEYSPIIPAGPIKTKLDSLSSTQYYCMRVIAELGLTSVGGGTTPDASKAENELEMLKEKWLSDKLPDASIREIGKDLVSATLVLEYLTWRIENPGRDKN